MAATVSVQTMGTLLVKQRLLGRDAAKALFAKWAETAAVPEDAEGFRRWLIEQGTVTEYQASLLAHGRTEGYWIDEYCVLDRLGQGRMAGVYRAMSPQGTEVALKVLPPSRSKNPTLLARFQREAKMSLNLDHPNVVKTFAFGEYEGLHYLVMEFLVGETLEDVLKRRTRMPPGEAVFVIQQALLGLQHIHERGMIHRDLKPANLMLLSASTDTTLSATVKILDIGLGRTIFDEGPLNEQEAQLTGEGVLLGTPDYLAPEQARDARAADIRSDIYSLGCVLYHALSGQPPFPDSNVLNQMIRHAREEARPLHDFNPSIPDGLQQVVAFMMAKEPDRRYPTPERAAAALQLFLPVTTPDLPSPTVPMEKITVVKPDPKQPAPGEVPVGKLVSSGKSVPKATTPAAEAAKGKAPAPAPAPAPEPVKAVKPPVAAPPPAPEPAKKPAGPVAPLPGDYDVELVAIPFPPPVKPKLPRDQRPLYDLDRRDFIMLGGGVAGTLGAILAAMGLAKAFRKKPE